MDERTRDLPDSTSRVLQKGRSARNRRPAVGWGGTGVVVAVAAALLGPAGQRPSAGPAHSGIPSPTVTSPASSPATSPATVTATPTGDPLMMYATKLPMGSPIALIPRAEKRGTVVVVVTANHVVTLPVDTVMAFDLTSSGEGLLVSTHAYGFTGGGPDPEQALHLIRPDGRLTTLHKGPFDGSAVDPTGKKFAIAEIGEGLGAPVHIVITSLSEPGATVRHTEREATRLLGWTTQGLLMSDTSRTWLWEPGASSEPEIPSVLGASVMPTDPGRLLVAIGTVGNPRSCYHLLHLSAVRGRQMDPELTCGTSSDWTVSPDSRRAVIGSTVVDLASGRVGPELMDNLATRFGHWEDSTHVLTHIVDPAPKGQIVDFWVRCDDSTGACERAPIRTSNNTSAVIDW